MYTFETHNDTNINPTGTCLRGYLDCPRHVLVELFGEPLGSSDKVINEWYLEVTDAADDESNEGVTDIITIYDWKNYDMSSLPDDYHNWNIGGNCYAAERVIHELIAQLRTK